MVLFNLQRLGGCSLVRSLMQNRNYLTLMIGQLVSTFGNNLYAIALPWFVYATTGSKADLAIVSMAGALPQVLGLFTGVFVDRWPKLRILMLADVIRMILCGCMAAIAAFRPALWPIVILTLLLQVVGTFFGPAAGAIVPSIVSQDEISQAVGFEQSTTATVQLLGMLSGGSLLSVLGAPLLFAFDGISFAVSAISVWLMPFRRTSEATASPKTSHPFWSSFREGLQMFARSKFLLLTLIAASFVNFAFAPFDLVLTAWVKGPLHGSAFDLGLVNASFFLGVIVGGVTLNAIMKRCTIRWIFFVSLISTGLATGLMGIWVSAVVDCLIALWMGFMIGTLNGGFSALASRYIPAEARGRAFGTIGALFSMATPLGMAIFGLVITHSPLRDALFAMGSLGTAGGLLYLLPIREDLANAFSPRGDDTPMLNAGETPQASP